MDILPAPIARQIAVAIIARDSCSISMKQILDRANDGHEVDWKLYEAHRRRHNAVSRELSTILGGAIIPTYSMTCWRNPEQAVRESPDPTPEMVPARRAGLRRWFGK